MSSSLGRGGSICDSPENPHEDFIDHKYVSGEDIQDPALEVKKSVHHLQKVGLSFEISAYHGNGFEEAHWRAHKSSETRIAKVRALVRTIIAGQAFQRAYLLSCNSRLHRIAQ
jgi:hypothetical protein